MVLRNFLWEYSGRLLTIVVGIIITGVLSRILSPTDYGIMGLVMAVSGIASMFLEFGFGSAIVQKNDITNKQLSTIFYLNSLVGLFIYCILFLSAPYISEFYNVEELTIILRTVTITFVINPLNLVPSALIQKQMLFKQQAVRNIFTTILIGSLAIWLAYNGWGVWSLVFQSLLGAIIGLIINFMITRWKPTLYFKIGSLYSIFRYSSYLFLSSLINNVYSKFDIFLIGKVFSLSTLGQYSRAQGFEGMVRGVSSSSLLSVLFPYFSKNQDNESLLLEQWKKYFNIICFVYFLIMGFSFISAKIIFLIFFGDQWLEASDYFKLISLIGFVYPLSSLALSIIEARGYSKVFFHVEVLKKIVIFPCFLIAYYYGIKYFLVSLIFSYFIGFILNLIYLKKALNYNIKASLIDLSKYIFIISSFLLSLSFLNYNYFLNSTNIIVVTMVNGFFLFFYLLSTTIFQPTTINLLWKLLNSNILKK